MKTDKQRAKELLTELEGHIRVTQTANSLDVDFAARGKRRREIIKEIQEKYLEYLEGADKWKFEIYSKEI